VPSNCEGHVCTCTLHNGWLLPNRNKGCVTNVALALPFTLKKYLKGKRRIMETQNISPSQNIIFKKPSKRKQSPSRY
jgi:hypothetical protein